MAVTIGVVTEESDPMFTEAPGALDATAQPGASKLPPFLIVTLPVSATTQAGTRPKSSATAREATTVVVRRVIRLLSGRGSIC
ncbi:hypothetical protein ACFQU2_08935 [Siccirubricoccus deserti]